MEVYEVKVEEHHESETSLGLFKDLKDAIKTGGEYTLKRIKKYYFGNLLIKTWE